MFSSEESESDNIFEENFIDFGITDISSIHLKINTSYLNLHYNSISVIKGLDKLINLRHLDLSSNLIPKISGLDSLIFLRTLNLSANRIKKIEGISKLRQLVKLNISYNEVCDVSGLGELANTPSHPLTVIELQGNQIKLVTHLIKNCQKLPNLRQLILNDNNSSNPVCNTPDYRNKVLSSLVNLRILDGKDRNGQPIDVHVLSDIPGLEQFMEYLSSSTDHYSDITQLEHLKSKLNPSGIPNKEQQKVNLKESNKDNGESSSELKFRLQELENKLAMFASKAQEENRGISKLTKIEEENPGKIKDGYRKESKRSDSREKKENTDVKMANLMKELNREQQMRIDMENKLQVVVNKYKDMQLMLVNDKKSKTDAIKSTEQLVAAYSQEKATRHELQDTVSDLQTQLTARETEIADLKETMDSFRGDISSKLALKDNLILAKVEEIAQINKNLEESRLAQKIAATNAASVKKHCDNLEDQVNNLQATLIKREKEYQTSLENKYSLNSKELKDYIETQVNAARNESGHEINAWKIRITDADNRYKDLENEFRVALHMEADRYKKLEHSYMQLLNEMSSLKKKLESLTKKDEESRSLISELTNVAKDQKGKLIELSHKKQETNRNNKERILTLEAHLEEARKQMLQFELTKQDNKKIQAKLTAQESILEGLRTERKLWSEELARQGYLLTQDRSKLECKIESQCSQINCLKMEMEKEAETMKIQSKIIEDQTATILKIKQGLSEKDVEARAFTEKLLEDQKEMEARNKDLVRENSDYKDTVSRLTKRKEELKDMIVELQEKLDESQNTHEMINQKWKDKSELIAKLENQVVQMKSYWENKTSEVIEERNEAQEKLSGLQAKMESIEHNYKSQLEMAYKNRDFIRQEADERVMLVEDEMRRLLSETEEEKRKLNSRLKILNKAIKELDNDPSHNRK